MTKLTLPQKYALDFFLNDYPYDLDFKEIIDIIDQSLGEYGLNTNHISIDKTFKDLSTKKIAYLACLLRSMIQDAVETAAKKEENKRIFA